MSELTECYADQAAINERYRTAHRDMAALRQRVAALEEALIGLIARFEDGCGTAHLSPEEWDHLKFTVAPQALATTEGE